MVYTFDTENSYKLSTKYARTKLNDGDIIIFEKEKKSYTYKNNDLVLNENKTISVDTTELFKSYYNQLEDLTDKSIQENIKDINQLITDDYAVLYCPQIHYYTVFTRFGDYDPEDDSIGAAAINCIKPLGTIKSIERTADNNVVFWVKTTDGNIISILLANYNNGVVSHG